MRFLGQMEAASFIEEHPGQAETMRAWLTEMRYRKWRSPKAIAMDFKSADVSSPPRVIFRLGQPVLTVETLMDFHRGIVLLTGIRIANRAAELTS